MKVCIIASAGGHLTEVLQVNSTYSKYEHFYVTFKRKDIKDKLRNEKVYFINDPKRNPLKFLYNFFQSLRIFLKERPDLIISTGAGMAIMFCYIAKLFGKKVIFIESLAAVDTPSFSGKFIYPISDLFIVQWEKLLKFYPKAIYGGTLI